MEFILYEVNGAVGTITINREKALNALNSTVLDELNQTLDHTEQCCTQFMIFNILLQHTKVI